MKFFKDTAIIIGITFGMIAFAEVALSLIFPQKVSVSNPLLVTDAYSALVRVSENTITSITENFSFGN